MDIRDEIKSRLPIEQLVAQYCQLQKKGRNFVCVCPFHNDTRPSFLVSPDKGIGYCFACNTGGDIFSFFQKIESVDFPTALRQLADKAGVTMPEQAERPSFKAEKDAKESIAGCLEAACTFFQSKLASTPVASEYIIKRGVTPELINTFRIGYAPDSFSETYDHLLKAGFSRSDIVGAGLGVQKELSEQRIYDRFRHRIMFPILDPYGHVIGFGGRAMDKPVADPNKTSDAKYVNTPDGTLYHKSTVLFGLHQAKESMRQLRKVILVEGYFDVVACAKAGVENVVAVCGTALTDQHVKILKRYADTVILCLDQDAAGRQAADRAFTMLSKQNVTVECLILPDKDPDEMVQRDMQAFKSMVTNGARGYLSAFIESLKARHSIQNPEGKRAIIEALFPLFSSLPSSTELRSYLQKAAADFGLMETEMSADFFTWRNSSRQLHLTKPVQSVTEATPFSRYELAMGMAMIYPNQRQILTELIPSEQEHLGIICEAIIQCGPDGDILAAIAGTSISSQQREQVNVLLLYCEENFSHWSEAMAAKEIKKLCASANRHLILAKQSALIEQLKAARQAGKIEDETRLLGEYQQVLKLANIASR